MLRIPCPYCELRDESEFIFGGPAHVTRPGPEVDDRTWTRYLFTRDNPVGIHYERWLHAYGCGLWFHVVRNVSNHTILHVYEMNEPKPEHLGQ